MRLFVVWVVVVLSLSTVACYAVERSVVQSTGNMPNGTVLDETPPPDTPETSPLKDSPSPMSGADGAFVPVVVPQPPRTVTPQGEEEKTRQEELDEAFDNLYGNIE